jgi:hypothetical protein
MSGHARRATGRAYCWLLALGSQLGFAEGTLLPSLHANIADRKGRRRMICNWANCEDSGSRVPRRESSRGARAAAVIEASYGLAVPFHKSPDGVFPVPTTISSPLDEYLT